MHNDIEILNKIIGIVKTNFKSVVLDPKKDIDRSMSEIGLDSLDIMTLFLEIEEKLGVKIPDEVVDELNTLRSITHYVQKKII